jgi:hypothetical protein
MLEFGLQFDHFFERLPFAFECGNLQRPRAKFVDERSRNAADRGKDVSQKLENVSESSRIHTGKTIYLKYSGYYNEQDNECGKALSQSQLTQSLRDLGR